MVRSCQHLAETMTVLCSSNSDCCFRLHPVSIPFSANRSLKAAIFNVLNTKSGMSKSNSCSQLPNYGKGMVMALKSSAGDGSVDPPAKSLRRLLQSPGIHLGPACFDALSAKLVERAGFDFCFTTGFGISASRLGLPDTGLISFGEMIDQGRQITESVSIPIIGDGDNGYGNAMNVKRTIRGYIRAGFAGIILEDQVSPKACGHTQGRRVVSREEAVMKIKAAVDARKESGSDIVIVARTDSRQAVSLEESLWRSRALADAGADVLFIDALASKEEMTAFCEVSPLVPKMANMLEGGGKTPILSPMELADVGYKLVAYPLSLMGVSIRAMQDALMTIKGGGIPSPGNMPSFDELKEILGFTTYYEEEMQYSTNTSPLPSDREAGFSSTTNFSSEVQPDEDKSSRGTYEAVVEVLTPEVYNDYDGSDRSRNPFSGIWSRKLRVKITARDGSERLDVRIPAGFLDGITNTIPALGGINMKKLLDDAASKKGGGICWILKIQWETESKSFWSRCVTHCTESANLRSASIFVHLSSYERSFPDEKVKSKLAQIVEVMKTMMNSIKMTLTSRFEFLWT